MDAFAKQDANAISALYTIDCKTMPPGSDVVYGQAGIFMSSLLVEVLVLSLVYVD